MNFCEMNLFQLMFSFLATRKSHEPTNTLQTVLLGRVLALKHE